MCVLHATTCNFVHRPTVCVSMCFSKAMESWMLGNHPHVADSRTAGNFHGQNLCGLLTFAMPKDATPPNFTEKTFTKVFSFESFPLHGMWRKDNNKSYVQSYVKTYVRAESELSRLHIPGLLCI